MSILGVVLRVLPEQLTSVTETLQPTPGLDIALNPGDGRLVLILEDTAERAAAQTFATIALLPGVLNASLVYEYSGPDVPHTESAQDFDTRYQSWRTTLSQMAEGQGLAAPVSSSPA